MAFPANIDLQSLDGTDGVWISSPSDGDPPYGPGIGHAVASAGDVNGDGIADLMIGSLDGSYIVFGSASGFGPSFDLSTLDGTDGFRFLAGYLALASAGDVNGDGFADLIVGDPYAPRGLSNQVGASYVLFGQASGFSADIGMTALDGTAGFKILGAAAGDMTGYSVASAGDINGDGYDDLIVGAPKIDSRGSTESGGSYVIFGKASGFGAEIDLRNLDSTVGFRLLGWESGDLAGFSVASAGDVNGDGYDDLIVGAPRASLNGYNSGASYVVFGAASGLSSTYLYQAALGDLNKGFILSGAAGDRSGTSVASAGDVNGDGYDDLIIGAPYARNGIVRSGTTYVVFGKAVVDTNIDLSAVNGTNGFKLHGERGSESGYRVSSAGDVNGDGFADVIVGGRKGYSYVVFGKASGFAAEFKLADLDGTNGFRLHDVVPSYEPAGYSVSSAGDVNGDGYDDLIVGGLEADLGPEYNYEYRPGSAYVVFGGAFGESTAPVTITGSMAAEVLMGGRGDDVLTGGGGADVFHAGTGDDLLRVADLTFRRVDGGNGIDTLALAGAGLVLDLTTAVSAGRLEGIERIDLTGSGGNTLKIDGAAVLGGVGAASGGGHVLTVVGDSGDRVVLGELGWTKVGFLSEGSILFDRWVRGDAELHVQQGIGMGLPIVGTAGATIVGGKSADWLLGAAGDEILDGRQGADTMVGDLGDDTYRVDDEGDEVVELDNGGIDTVNTNLSSYALSAHVENVQFFGTGDFTGHGNELANILIGRAGNDTLDGGDGNDTLRGGGGEDRMTGGAGDDTYRVDDAGDEVVELDNGGIDTVNTNLSSYTLSAHVENVQFFGTGDFIGHGNQLANILMGRAGNDTLDGGDGNDTLRGGGGEDRMTGGAGDDTYRVDDAGDEVVELDNGGIDTVNTNLSSYTLSAHVENVQFFGTGDFTGHGNELANILIGRADNDTLDGGDGNDTLRGGGGEDRMTGGAGDDTYGVDNADDLVIEMADDGTDTVKTTLSSYALGAHVENLEFFGTGDFTGHGNELTNILIGRAGNDTLDGGDGNDTLRGGGGEDRMTGGVGDDTYSVDNAGDEVVEMADGGIDTVATNLASYTLGAHVENVQFFGTRGIGYGNELDNILRGGAGSDTLFGGDGNDMLVGGIGNDVLNGGAGEDKMDGGTGDDTYRVDDAGDEVVERPGGGKDGIITTLSSYALGAHVEHLQFIGTGDFTGQGNARANILTGGAGNDRLSGGDGADRLLGGMGADVLIGGRDGDTLTGGGGADVFVFGDSFAVGTRDTITDFRVGEDVLDFTQMSTTGFHALQIVTSLPSTIDAHSLVAFVTGGGATLLYVNDTDAAVRTSSPTRMSIELTGVTRLSDADLDYFLI